MSYSIYKSLVKRSNLPFLGGGAAEALDFSLENIADYLDTHLAPYSSCPTATILIFAGAVIPTGWLFCDGSAISRTTYAALFAAIGANFGGGDESTTFNLPDMRYRVPYGADGDSITVGMQLGGGEPPNYVVDNNGDGSTTTIYGTLPPMSTAFNFIIKT